MPPNFLLVKGTDISMKQKLLLFLNSVLYFYILLNIITSAVYAFPPAFSVTGRGISLKQKQVLFFNFISYFYTALNIITFVIHVLQPAFE
jgi:hypothetical protein